MGVTDGVCLIAIRAQCTGEGGIDNRGVAQNRIKFQLVRRGNELDDSELLSITKLVGEIRTSDHFPKADA